MFHTNLPRSALSRRVFYGSLALLAALGVVLAATAVDVGAIVGGRSAPAFTATEVPPWAQPEFSPDRGWHREPITYDHMFRSDRSDSRR